VEAPASEDILPLADFSTVNFSSCSAASNGSGGQSKAINFWPSDPLTMNDPEGGEATPSALSNNGTAFSVSCGSNGGGGSSGAAINGTYEIVSKNSGMCLDAYYQGTSDGTPLDQYYYFGGTGQQWTVSSLGNGYCKIIGVGSGKSVDVNDWGGAGTQVQLWDYNGGSNQQFAFISQNNGYYVISPAYNSDLGLDVWGASTSPSAKIDAYTLNGGANQEWALNTVVESGHVYKLKNANSGKVLGIQSMSTSDGADALQWDDNGTSDHLWTLTQLSDGNYKLTNGNSGKVLGIQGMSTSDGADALQWDDNGTKDHEWTLTQLSDGNFKLKNANSGKVLGIQNMSTSDGANAMQWDDSGTLDHEWTLEFVQ
jgi:hypothetical protein